MVKIGDIIGGYRLVAELGGGGFATVYKGEHLFFEDKPVVAIKVLHPHLISQEQQTQFIREAQLLKKLEHPHILPILDAGIHHEQSLYLILAYAVNGSLQGRIKSQHSNPFPIDEATRILSQIGDALQYAHEQNVTHCDLKPENILFNAQGDALLADFGIAVVLASGKTEDVGRRGTLYYMAPEQFNEKVSKKSDEYALGCIAYELFTGRRPFVVPHPTLEIMWNQHANVKPTPPTQFNPNLPIHIEQAILKAIAKDRAMRHPDVKAFITALHKTKEQWLDEGKTLLEAKVYEKALAACEQAIRLDPYDARAYHCKGKVFYALKRYEEALADYERAIQRDPTNASVYNDKGDALCELKRYEEALVAYERATQIDARSAHAYCGKGTVQRAREYYHEALATYEWAIQLDPNNAPAHRGQGVALRNLKRYKEALTAYERAIQLDPNHALAYLGKGAALSNLKRAGEALAAYEEAIRLAPDNADAYGGKGEVLYLWLDREEEALAAYEEAIRLAPDNANAYGGKGEVLLFLGRYEEALAVLEQAIHLDISYAFAYYDKGRVLEALGRLEEAEQAFKKARQLGYKE